MFKLRRRTKSRVNHSPSIRPHFQLIMIMHHQNWLNSKSHPFFHNTLLAFIFKRKNSRRHMQMFSNPMSSKLLTHRKAIFYCSFLTFFTNFSKRQPRLTNFHAFFNCLSHNSNEFNNFLIVSLSY